MVRTPKVAGFDTLTVPERLLLFCIASGTNPREAGITNQTIELLVIRGLIRRNDKGLVLTSLGRATIEVLLSCRK
jgi:hypothetical protein